MALESVDVEALELFIEAINQDFATRRESLTGFIDLDKLRRVAATGLMSCGNLLESVVLPQPAGGCPVGTPPLAPPPSLPIESAGFVPDSPLDSISRLNLFVQLRARAGRQGWHYRSSPTGLLGLGEARTHNHSRNPCRSSSAAR